MRNKRFRVITTTAGYRIYDFKIFDVVKVKGQWFLSDYEKASVLCTALNQLQEGV